MTERVGIIGWPLTTTFSPAMHNAAFEALGLDWHYEAMAIPPDVIRLGILEPQRHGFIGLNVTIPHKEAALNFVTPDAIARAVGAVNTIDLRNMTGTNTDVAGFIQDLKAHDVALEGRRALVIGAGGAARAAVVGLAGQGVQVSVVNRDATRAQTMLANLSLSNLSLNAEAVTWSEVADSEYDVLVNCTPVGMLPNPDTTPWPDAVPFPKSATLYDMIYRPATTRLMQQAEQSGGQAIGGLGMLVYQGAAAFKIWTGVEAPIEIMMNAVRAELFGGV
jgi:shikimate dehydrogenase